VHLHFSGSVCIGIMLAYLSSWGSSLHIDKTSTSSWVIPTTMHIMFAGIILVPSLFNYKSPRFLIKIGHEEHAVANLARIRCLPIDHEVVVAAINDIKIKFEEEKEVYGSGV